MKNWLRATNLFLKHVNSLSIRDLPFFLKKFRNSNPHRHKGRIFINTFIPPFPSPGFDRFVKTLSQAKRIPISTYLALTENCPYKCPHCSYGLRAAGHMDTAATLDVIEQIKALGTMIVGFTGGEPLLRKDIAKLVEAVRPEATSIIFTTGHNLTEPLAKDLSSAGLDCLTVGIESPDPEEHDAIRGVPGSFATALKAIRISAAAGFYTSISTVGTRDKLTSGKLHRLAQMAADMDLHEFRILEPIPTGNYQGKTEHVLTAEQARELADFHAEWNRRRKGPSVACFAYLESDEMMGCGAGFHHLYVDAIGNVCPCDLTPLSLGNINEEPLADIWQRMGKWFDSPRCGCFSKSVTKQINSNGDDIQLPVPREKSEQICTACPHSGKTPQVYQRLHKNKS